MLQSADLDEISIKKIRKELEERFNCPMKEKKEMIKQIVTESIGMGIGGVCVCVCVCVCGIVHVSRRKERRMEYICSNIFVLIMLIKNYKENGRLYSHLILLKFFFYAKVPYLDPLRVATPCDSKSSSFVSATNNFSCRCCCLR